MPLPILADLVSDDFNGLSNRVDGGFSSPRILLLQHMALTNYLKASYMDFVETEGLPSLTDQTTNLSKFIANENIAP